MGVTSEAFECKTGSRQGDALSPVLFNLAMEQVVRDIDEKREMELVGMNTLLVYEDDLVILIILGASTRINEIKTSAEKLFKQFIQNIG